MNRLPQHITLLLMGTHIYTCDHAHPYAYTECIYISMSMDTFIYMSSNKQTSKTKNDKIKNIKSIHTLKAANYASGREEEPPHNPSAMTQHTCKR